MALPKLLQPQRALPRRLRGDRTYVVVRFPSMGTVFGALTTRFPACTVDAVLEATRIDADGPTYTTMTLVRGLPPAAVDEAIDALGKRYDRPPTVLERTPNATLLRYHLAGKDLAPALRALARFQVDFGAPWSHIEGGLYSMRARVPFGADARVLADRMLAALESAGVAAEVEVRLIGGRELGGWYEIQDAMDAAKPKVAWWRRVGA